MAWDDEVSAERYLNVVREASRLATPSDGMVADKFTRAAIGYFILQGAREGIRDPAELARTALARFMANPQIMTMLAEEIGKKQN